MLLFEDTDKKEKEKINNLIKSHNLRFNSSTNYKKPVCKNDAFNKDDASSDAVAILRKSQYACVRKSDFNSLKKCVDEEIRLKKGIVPSELCSRNVLI